MIEVRIKSKLIVAISILLTVSSVQFESANAAKAGSSCKKIGATQITSGKKFTCIKKGGKLVWNSGSSVKKSLPSPTVSPTPSPSPTPSSSSSPTPSPSPTPNPTFSEEPTDSYLTNTRRRANSGIARALSTNSAVVIREDASTGSKAFRVKIISPKKDGVSFDSGLIQDYAENISLFVEGTICYVIYANEFISYRDLEGKVVASNARHNETPRAEFAECPASALQGIPIVPGPISLPKKGVQIIYSDFDSNNSLKIRIQGSEFKSYQLSLESLLNGNTLWTSPIKNASVNKIHDSIPGLSCDARYSVRVKMWSDSNGLGNLISNVSAHSFTTPACDIKKTVMGTEIIEGGQCPQVGKQAQQSAGYLECRRVVGDRNAWTLVDKNSSVIKFAEKKESIDLCKLGDLRPPNYMQTLNHSFPRPNKYKPATGEVDIALVGIDFSDAQGSGKPFDQEPNLQKNFNEWADFWSAGKLKFKWHELNEWTRVPGKSIEYNQKYSDSANEQMAKEIFTLVDKRMPLKDVEIVLIYFPESLKGTDNGYMPYKAVTTQISSGSFSPYYWGGDPSTGPDGSPQNVSWYYYHEMLHGIGFSLHAPGNGFLLGPTNIEEQYGKNLGYGSPAYVDIWSGFVNGWYDENNIVCLDRKNLNKTTIQLESIDVNPKGQTSAMIKLSDKEILVIESRRSGPFTNLPKGMAGVTVTKVDTSKLYARFDRSVDGFDWELLQWAYYVRTDQEKSPEWFVRADTPSRILGYQGETFTIDGVKITVKSSSTFDTVEIERTN